MEGLVTGYWRDRSVLVTGGTGLVGGWLIPRLVEAGAAVSVLVRDWVPQSRLLNSPTLSRVNLIRGDICDRDLLERALGEYEVDTVFHLAAQTIVTIANRNPIGTFESNIRGTWSLLEACRCTSTVKAIVVASSDKAYGEHDTLPYSEHAPLQGRHPYDVSKSCGDLIASAYVETYGLPVCVTRCGNFYGGGDLNWNRIVPGTLRSIFRGERPVIRSDGRYIRDYFYVEDGASAYLQLAELMRHRPELAGEAFNFSNEVQVSVLELVEKILLIMQSPLKPDIQEKATHEIRHQYLSAAKAKSLLGWCPTFSLDEGLVRTVDWYRTYLSGEE